MICRYDRLKFKFGVPIKIKTIFDVHIGNTYCDEKKFQEYLAEADENTYFLGGGDLIDCVIVTDQKRYRKTVDASTGDSVLDYQRDRAIDILKPFKDKILVLGSGNHEDNIVKRCGTNITKTICQVLGIPYGGYSYFERLILENGTNRRKIDFHVHHGYGGGRSDGGDLTKYSRDSGNYEADVFLYGHGHKLQHYSKPIIGTNGKKLVAKSRTVVLCGTFLKTLSDGEDPTYSEIAGFSPISIGAPTISIMVKPEGFKISVTT